MGLNLAFYDPGQVESVTGVDPSPELRAIALAAPRDPALNVRVQEGTAEALPFEDKSFDCVVCTFTLCSVCEPQQALTEARRVLKPGGRLLYCEHGLSPDPKLAKWQRRWDPLWKRIAGGCHLSRPITSAIEAAGFRTEWTDSMMLPGTPPIAGWNEWGAAVRS
jgi:ubiquinone/menaquinone biosynthesis C-methylase UbiE